MFFNSIEFALFLPIVFILYWLVSAKRLTFQNIILLVASYFFYAFWDWRFLFLLLFSTILDYSTAIFIDNISKKSIRKIFLYLSILINLGFLCVFKYYNFFIANFIELFRIFKLDVNFTTISIILPVGISFYTFHGISYIIDIYNKKILPEKNFVNYSLFVSFFPLLVAGPIERATHLLPQIKMKREFNFSKSMDGLLQILFGLFKKIVIADNCSGFVNTIFNNSSNYSGSTMVIGAIFFSIQIYCDFSGYSDIALGTARLFGIELLKNFSFPYFSRDIAEFWRRWHISLSSWFRDYLYIPLGGGRGKLFNKIRNIFIIFIVSGFWHGANWTFIIWGIINAIYFLLSIYLFKNIHQKEIVAKGKFMPSVKEFLQILSTFILTTFAWIFFRSNSIKSAFEIITSIFSKSLFQLPYFPGIGKSPTIIILIFLFFFIEWIGREKQHPLQLFYEMNCKRASYLFFFIIGISIILFGNFEKNEFIYFQF